MLSQKRPRQTMDTLVSTEWLSQHLDDPELVVLDCSVYQESEEGGGFHNVSGLAKYNDRHIPFAGFADLKGELCDISSPIEFAVPTPEQFCSAMGALGVGDDSRVVLYDASYSAWAARVWWMLRWIGFDHAAILDGGLNTWIAEERPLTTIQSKPVKKQLTLSLRPELVADSNEVFAAIDDPAINLIDTLPAHFYRGEATLYARRGHIPGASNICGLDLLDDSGRFRSNDELAAVHRGNRSARTITYCGGGIMASVNAFAMTRLGFNNVAVYTASLQEWAADPTRPMVLETEMG